LFLCNKCCSQSCSAATMPQSHLFLMEAFIPVVAEIGRHKVVQWEWSGSTPALFIPHNIFQAQKIVSWFSWINTKWRSSFHCLLSILDSLPLADLQQPFFLCSKPQTPPIL
jgi:hypothetical protein